MNRLLTALALFSFVLAGCGDGSDAAGDGPDAPVTEDAPPESTARSGDDCLIGTWAVDAAYSFRPEQWDNIIPAGSGLSFEFGGAEGEGLLVFEPDGSVQQRFADLAITIDADSPAGAVSTTVRFDGTADGTYNTEGNDIRFVPGDADLATRVRATLGGSEMMNSEMDFESLFETAERSRVTFTCTSDDLLLDIYETPEGGNVMFEDARYVRVGPAS